ncbi:hypothetical protein [Hyphomonas johnsonii]|uniref:Uncharacterized protein n=1 Tax=Hyphomonas johnsonii MHS-2 TaxID=1280950 RepID=A0A059FJI1_9PROT|nr:hypothetical protein [Hyphomonas johnsonii]KCZ90794.1 hypothetical protein HJO_13121 [Hyphomonas johnsonii MHS-2]
MNEIFRELRRRNVFRVAAVYAVVGWLLIQVGVAVLPTFEAPGWVLKVFIALIFAGFAIAIVFAWAFEVTPEGMRPTAKVAEGESIAPQTGRKLDMVILAGLALVAVMIIGDRLMPEKPGQGVARSETHAPGGASVAVLPFIDLSPDGDQEYFSDGISEEILNVLVRIPQLKVAGRTSSFSFKGKNDDLRDIGTALGVDHVLEGSVRKSGTKLRITAQLIRSDDGFHIWSETYDRELTDIFNIQDDIAKSVASELALSLGLKSGETLVRERTDDVVAYEKYLKARQLYFARGLDNLDTALLLLYEVTARDPDFAPGWSTIAGIYTVYESYQPVYPPQGNYHQWRATGQAAARRAIVLDPDNAEAHVYLGALLVFEGDLIAGVAAIDKAVELAPENPNVLDAAAQELVTMGYGDEAIMLARRAVAADPLVAIYHNTLGYTTDDSGELVGMADAQAAALEELAKAREYGPDLQYGYTNAYLAYLRAGKLDEARAMFKAAIDAGLIPQQAMEKVDEMIAAARQGKPALRALLPKSGAQVSLAINMLLQDADLTIASLEPVWKQDYQVEPALFLLGSNEVYQHPRWKEEVRKQGILALWKSRGFPSWCKPVGADDFECTRG